MVWGELSTFHHLNIPNIRVCSLWFASTKQCVRCVVMDNRYTENELREALPAELWDEVYRLPQGHQPEPGPTDVTAGSP